MVFITCNQPMGLLLFAKQTSFTPFVMHSIVGKVNNNALLLQTVLYWKWGYVCGNCRSMIHKSHASARDLLQNHTM